MVSKYPTKDRFNKECRKHNKGYFCKYKGYRTRALRESGAIDELIAAVHEATITMRDTTIEISKNQGISRKGE